MARFSNFSIWRGRLPHWRADGETYYVTFRHRRALDEGEMNVLFARLLRAQRRRLNILVMAVLPEATEMVFRLQESTEEAGMDLSDVIEKEKRKAASLIAKKTGEIRPVFYGESYDRIIRDEAELDETLARIYSSPEDAGLVESAEEYPCLFAADGASEG